MAENGSKGAGRNGLTYREAGVDVDAGAELIRRIAPAAARTRRPEQLNNLGGFAALTAVPARYREPVLVTGTDGVGTKLRLAIDHGRHDEIGQDLVAMCVNDVLVTGAEPLVFLDYYATGHLDVAVAERVIAGIARGCELAGCTLAGGETAEMPGFYGHGDYDLSGFCVGIAERERIIDTRAVQPGDRLIALASSGPHANGYALVRRILEGTPAALEREPRLLARLLAPTRIYVEAVRGLLDAGLPIHGMAHVTGGGLPDNLARLLPAAGDANLAAVVDLSSWQPPDVFAWLRTAGGLADMELLHTFNCGVGFVLCVPAAAETDILAALESAGERAWSLGAVTAPTNRPAGPALVIPAGAPAQLIGAWT